MKGIPYMGSKRRLSRNIVNAIRSRHPESSNLYDLFGGGGAISFEALKYNWRVHYNELNSHVFELMRYLKKNKSLGDEFYKWYSREEFFKIINGKPYYLSGFVKTCWSFGNDQASYLYGSEIENDKRLSHNIVTHRCINSAKELGFEHYKELFNIEGINERRLVFTRHYKNNIQHLGYLEHLQRIQELERIQELNITNLSYNNVTFLDNSVIYCDPPYANTKEYSEGGFDSDKFFEWFATLPFPAYLSEYNAPFEIIESYRHRSTLSATNNNKQVFENLYWNGKGNINNYKLF